MGGGFRGYFWRFFGGHRPWRWRPGGFFSQKSRMLRWASADLVPFSTFFAFFARFLPVLGPYFALFPSMSCTYLYVHNFPRTRVSRFGRKNLAFDKETAAATRPPDPDRVGTRAALSKVEGRNPGAPGERGTEKARAIAPGSPPALSLFPLDPFGGGHVLRRGGENLAFDKETAEATGENDEIYPPGAGPNDERRGPEGKCVSCPRNSR